MTWTSVIVPFIVVVGIVYVPGMALAAAIGARRFLLMALAPAAGIGFFGVAAIAFPFLGIRWSLASALTAIAAFSVLVWAVRLLLTRSSRHRLVIQGRPDRWSPGARGIAVAWSLGAVIAGVQLVLAIGAPDNVSQTFDADFHLNVVRFIEDTSNASSWHISQLILPPGTSSFYPAAWHDIVSLTALGTGAGIPVVANLASIATAALVWPSGCILLMRTLIPGSRVAVVAAGVLSGAFPAFPLLMLSYGVLYPYGLALSMLPLALALAVSILTPAPEHLCRLAERLLLLAVVLLGIGLAQPSVVFAWFAFLIPLIIVRLNRVARTTNGPMRAVIWISAAIGLLGFAVAWVVVGRLGANTPWPTYTNAAGAVFEALTYSIEGTPVAIVLTVLTVFGLVHLSRAPGRRWILGTWAIGFVLFATAVAMPSWRIRAWVVGLFYRDPPRLSALLIMVALPVAVFGAVAAWSFLTSAIRRRIGTSAGGTRSWRYQATVTALLLLLIVSTQGPAMWHAISYAKDTYALTPYSPLLSANERKLIDRLPSEVPAGAVIAGNPWTGTSFTYALVDRKVLNPHFNSNLDGRASVINLGLNQALTDPAVCLAVKALGVQYVLDFGTYTRDAGKTNVRFDTTSAYIGLTDVGVDGVAEKVDSEGGAVLYKITACG